MSHFFELRIYQVFPGKMDEWLNLMEKVIIPFQVSKGMVINGSFIENSFNQFYLNNDVRDMKTFDNRNKYIWIRRFENIKHRDDLYKKVYQSNEWLNNIGPKVEKLIDRNSISVHNITPTQMSVIK